MSAQKDNLFSYVIAAGILYGDGEDEFSHLFKVISIAHWSYPHYMLPLPLLTFVGLNDNSQHGYVKKLVYQS
jgi:hypothetical protein